MPSTFTLFEILIIIGLVQGLITAVLLLTNKDKQLGKRILGVTVLVFCIANCRVLLHSSGLWNVLSFRYFPVGMELFLPPLVYFYVKSLTEVDFKLSWQQIWHFVPGLIYAIYDITLYLLVINEDTFQAKRLIADSMYFNYSNEIEDYLIVLLTLSYIVLGFQSISRFLGWLKQFRDYKTFPIYSWLKSLIIWFAFLGLILLINQLLDTFSMAMDIIQTRWRFFNLTLAFVTYYIGFMGYKQHGLKIHEAKIKLLSKEHKLNLSNTHELETRLIKLLEDEQVYLDASLTLKMLAKELGVSAEILSLLVNQKFAMGFRDLINNYRVNQVKKRLHENQDHVHSILTLALDSGFNSQASFYRAFKKFEGISPKAYLDKFS